LLDCNGPLVDGDGWVEAITHAAASTVLLIP
jgi:hypothetical protein